MRTFCWTGVINLSTISQVVRLGVVSEAQATRSKIGHLDKDDDLKRAEAACGRFLRQNSRQYRSEDDRSMYVHRLSTVKYLHSSAPCGVLDRRLCHIPSLSALVLPAWYIHGITAQRCVGCVVFLTRSPCCPALSGREPEACLSCSCMFVPAPLRHRKHLEPPL